MKNPTNGWAHEGSYIHPQTDSAKEYGGKLVHNGITFHYSLNRQSVSKHLYRGTMSAIGNDGRILRAKDGKHIRMQLYCQETELTKIKAFLFKKAIDMYAQYTTVLMKAVAQHAWKNTIAPANAFMLHGMSFIKFKHPNASEEYKNTLYNRINRAFCAFPLEPMSEFTLRRMNDLIRENAIGESTVKQMRLFWSYCVDKNICGGGIPFPTPKRARRSITSAQNQAVIPDELSESQIEALSELVMQDPSPLNCSVAMQLFGGLSPEEIRELTWRDVEFHDDDPDYTVIELYNLDNAGATHLYSRPVFPALSRILHKRYEMCLAENSSKKLADEKIVDFSVKEIVNHSLKVLRSIDPEKTFRPREGRTTAVSRLILNATYRGLLQRKCGLSHDHFTYAYLCGDSLSKDVTSDHYISFSDDEAHRRQYTYMKIVKPREDYPERVVGEGNTREVFPPTNQHCAGAHIRIVLPPNAKITIKCDHGFEGDAIVRAIGADGKVKRKKRSSPTVAHDDAQSPLQEP